MTCDADTVRREVPVHVLIVESSEKLARLWQNHLQRSGVKVRTAFTQDEALAMLETHRFQVIILDVMLDGGNALAVADVAQFRMPEARVIFVTNSTFFSDGSIFKLCANACAYLPCATPPDDLTSMVHHYARAG